MTRRCRVIQKSERAVVVCLCSLNARLLCSQRFGRIDSRCTHCRHEGAKRRNRHNERSNRREQWSVLDLFRGELREQNDADFCEEQSARGAGERHHDALAEDCLQNIPRTRAKRHADA